MGLFKKLKKAFKKVTRGIKKVVKKTLSGLNKIQKKIRKSKLFKALVIAGAVIVTGGAAIGAFTGGTATGWAGWMMNASNTVAGGTLFSGTSTLAKAGNFATSMIAKPFATVGAAAGNAAAAVTDFTGLTTEAGRTAQSAQQAAITGQTATTATTSLTEDQIIQGLNPAEVAQAQTNAFQMPSTSVESQLASSTQTAFNAGSGTTTAGGLNIPTTLPSASYATGTPAQQLAQTVPSALGVSPVEATASVAEKLSITQRYPKTTAFLQGAGTSLANKAFDVYTDSLLAGDATGRGGAGIGEEAGRRKDPVSIYSNELNINPDDYSKHFTFGNIIEAGNMPLFQQETLKVT